jgi:peptide/nickel transport system permease protein
MSIALADTDIGAGKVLPRVLRAVLRHYSGRSKLIVGGSIVGAIAVVAIFSHLIAPYSPIELNLNASLQPPSSAHLMGTDEFGRDVLSRVLDGALLDLQIAAFGTFFCFLSGSILGLIAGFFGKVGDILIGRLIDVVIAFPAIVVIIALISVLGVSLVNLYIGITITGWTAYARLVRGETLAAKSLPYVQSARSLGYSWQRILFRHVMPNVITPAFIFLVTDMVGTILLVTSLSYLGLGPQPPTPEWGAIIAEARPFMLQAWWIALFPGLAIVLTGVGLALLGDGLADALRPEPD